MFKGDGTIDFVSRVEFIRVVGVRCQGRLKERLAMIIKNIYICLVI